VAQALVDDLGADRLLELTAGGDPSALAAEQQTEYFGAVDAAAQSCGVPIELVR
jgi:hypothetical protein